MTRIAAIQLNSTEIREKNFPIVRRLIQSAASEGAQLIALPENFSMMTEGRRNLLEAAEDFNGPSHEFLKEVAKSHKVWIVGGTIHLKIPGSKKLYNTSLLINPQGKTVARYDKIHLFDVKLSADREYQESLVFKPGKKIVTAKTPMGNLGLSVCYDLRFPELYRKMADKKVDIIFIPSAFTAQTGKAHWGMLTRARAVENLSYVVAPAQAGTHFRGRETHGHTRIIDPWGNVISEKKRGSGIVIADIDFREIAKRRKQLPSLKHRRV